jgi:hypothetical protein
MVEFTIPMMGMVVGLALLLFVLLGYEYRVPLLFTIIMVPLIVGIGMGAALALYIATGMYGVGITMNASVSIMVGLTLIGLIGFEWATT